MRSTSGWRRSSISRRTSEITKAGRHRREDTMRISSIAAAFAAILLGISSAAAQTYPSRTITIVVPFSAGGPTDILARLLGQHMSQTLKQQVVVENVTGGGGSIGSARVAKAASDGHTLVMGNLGTHAAAVGLYKN